MKSYVLQGRRYEVVVEEKKKLVESRRIHQVDCWVVKKIVKLQRRKMNKARLAKAKAREKRLRKLSIAASFRVSRTAKRKLVGWQAIVMAIGVKAIEDRL